MKTLLIREGKNGYTVERVLGESLLVDTWVFKPNEVDDMMDTIRKVIESPTEDKRNQPKCVEELMKDYKDYITESGEIKKDEPEN